MSRERTQLWNSALLIVQKSEKTARRNCKVSRYFSKNFDEIKCIITTNFCEEKGKKIKLPIKSSRGVFNMFLLNIYSWQVVWLFAVHSGILHGATNVLPAPSFNGKAGGWQTTCLYIHSYKILALSVPDPRHFGADPDPTFHFISFADPYNADPDPALKMRIRPEWFGRPLLVLFIKNLSYMSSFTLLVRLVLRPLIR